jgi:leucyl aminopeptidase
MPRLRTALPRWLAPTLLACASASATAAPVWVSMDEAALRVLQSQRIDHDAVERHAVTARAADQAVRQDTLVILRADDDQLHRLSLAAHEALHRCGGFMVHASREDARRTVAALQQHAGGERLRTLATVPSYVIDDNAQVNALLPQLQETQILSTITKLQSYSNRYYRNAVGAKASNDLAAGWAALAAGRSDASVSQFTHRNFPQKSVILTLRGSVAPDEIVVIGGHLDSISPNAVFSPTGKAPGADDDASGIATLQEVMRVVLQSGYQPARTLQFIGYAGEEAGLLGSKEIAQSYAAQGRNVVGALQLDMTAYPGGSSDITLISDYTNTAQDNFLAALASAYLPTVRVVRDVCGYACSDHASWTAQGFAASFPFEAPLGADNPHIHTPKDKPVKFGNSAAHAIQFARLALSYAVELGSDSGPAAR